MSWTQPQERRSQNQVCNREHLCCTKVAVVVAIKPVDSDDATLQPSSAHGHLWIPSGLARLIIGVGEYCPLGYHLANEQPGSALTGPDLLCGEYCNVIKLTPATPELGSKTRYPTQRVRSRLSPRQRIRSGLKPIIAPDTHRGDRLLLCESSIVYSEL